MSTKPSSGLASVRGGPEALLSPLFTQYTVP